jgi:hypothetical protein
LRLRLDMITDDWMRSSQVASGHVRWTTLG